MRKANWYTCMGSTKYANVPKFVFAFFASHLIIVYGEKFPSLEILATKFYFSALFVNATIAFIFIKIVYRINSGLDYFYPWSKSYKTRLRWQLWCGVFFVQMLAIGFTGCYFWLHSKGELDALNLTRYVPLSALMLTLLSAFLFFEWSTKNKSKSTPKSELKGPEAAPDLNWAISEIACVFIEDKYYFAYDFKGEKLIWKENLTTTINLLPAEHFYLIRSSFIVNRAAIEKIEALSSRATLVHVIAPMNLKKEVSRRENTSFKRWSLNRKSSP